MKEEQKAENKAMLIGDLGRLLRARRKELGLTLEETSQEIGVSGATLSRLERVHGDRQDDRDIDFTPDLRTVAAIVDWLHIPMTRILPFRPDDQRSSQSSLPDEVEAHLRADRNLDPEAAEVLGRMFRLAYEQLSTRREGETGV